jgi:hypothetical protein
MLLVRQSCFILEHGPPQRRDVAKALLLGLDDPAKLVLQPHQ